MTNNENWFREALIDSPRVYYNIDGSIEEQEGTIEVKVNFNEVNELRFEPDKKDYNEAELEDLAEKYEPGEFIDAEYRNGAYARLRFAVEDGVARLRSFKDAEPSSSDWVRVDFLRTLDAAQRVVEGVPGVERVESVSETLGHHLSDGQGAEINPA